MKWFATDQLATVCSESWDRATRIAAEWRYGKIARELRPGQFAHETEVREAK
jgi:hypothetical protein